MGAGGWQTINEAKTKDEIFSFKIQQRHNEAEYLRRKKNGYAPTYTDIEELSVLHASSGVLQHETGKKCQHQNR